MGWIDQIRTAIPGVVFIAIVLAAWQMLAGPMHVPKFLLPTPLAIVQEGLIPKWPKLLMHTEVTAYETVVGFLIGALLGVALAIGLAFSSYVRSVIYPTILTVHIVPKSAIAPLIILWLGLGVESKIVIAILVSFFPIVINTAAGFFAVPPEFLELTRSVKGKSMSVLATLRFPYAMPHIFDGLKIGITMAMIGAVVGEFVSAAKGLGYYVLITMVELETPTMYAGLLVLALLSYALYGAVLLAERMTIPWYFSMRKVR